MSGSLLKYIVLRIPPPLPPNIYIFFFLHLSLRTKSAFWLLEIWHPLHLKSGNGRTGKALKAYWADPASYTFTTNMSTDYIIIHSLQGDTKSCWNVENDSINHLYKARTGYKWMGMLVESFLKMNNVHFSLIFLFRLIFFFSKAKSIKKYLLTVFYNMACSVLYRFLNHS